MKKYTHIGCVIIVALSSSADAGLISVDFGYTGLPMIFNGVESQAAALDPLFANSSVWNGLELSSNWNETPNYNPVFNNLSDSDGNSTSVKLSVLGAVNAFNFSDHYSIPAPGPLYGDYWFFNSRDASSSLDWHLSGLAPGKEYRMVFYGANHEQDRTFDMILDTDGDGDLSNETTLPVESLAGAFPAPAYVASIFATANGEIMGRAAGRPRGAGDYWSYEANWAGFQIAAVPIPAAVWLFGSGLLGLVGVARQRLS